MTRQDAHDVLDVVAECVLTALDGPDARAAMLDACERYAQAQSLYNGWANRWTWLAHLWLTSDPETYGTAVALACEDGAPALAAMVQANALDVLDFDGAPAAGAYPRGFAADVLLSALESIDWPAVVAALTEE